MKRWLVGILCILLLSACAPSPEQLNNRGNRAFKQQEYERALQDYLTAQIELPEHAEPGYNAANTFTRQGDLQAAQERLLLALETASEELAPTVYYNLGNVFYEAQQYEQAVESYQQALRLDPDDMDAKHNLELALQKQQEKAQNEQTLSEQAQSQPEPAQPEAVQTETAEESEQGEKNPSPAPPSAPETLSMEEAHQLLEAASKQTQSLQQALQQVLTSAGSPSEKDW